MKILVVLPRFPYPLEKGDKLRAYHQIVQLSKHNDIYLFCVSHTKVLPEHLQALRPYCADIRVVRLNRLVCYLNILRNWFAAKSLQMGYWNTAHSKHACRSFARQVQPDIVYSQMVRTMPLVSRLPYPKVMDFQDALSLNTERRMDQLSRPNGSSAPLLGRGLWHYILHFEFKMLRSSEYNAFSIFDALTIISETDSEAIPHKKNSSIQIIPNGVDFDYFNTQAIKQSNDQEFSILFCGNMSYAPNVDAARYLVSDIMPLVWKQIPSATLLLAGADPKHTVRHLASQRVTVSGHLPDIRSAYASATLFVAPMRIGSGLQNKLLEAMSMQLPCITTPLANAALRATPGQHLLVADTPQAIANHIINLLSSPQLRTSIATAGNQFVHHHHSWTAAVQPLEKLLNAVRSK